MTKRTSQFDYDVAVIGGGSAGYAAARTASARGLKTVVLEGAETVGGLCILRGCMPTKTLLYAAEVRHLAQAGSVWGLETAPVGFDFQKVMERKDQVIEDFAAYRRKQLVSGQFEFRRQSGRFIDPHTVQLSDGSALTAAHFIIATGSKVAPTPLAALDKVEHLTSDDALELKSPPASLLVLGGGSVAMEFAQFFARFGTKVTVLQRSAHVLKEFDKDASTAVETALRAEGMTIHTGTKLVGARQHGSEKAVVFEKDGTSVECRATEILYALGRVPNIEDLGLDRAGVKTGGGQIITAPTQQTTAPHIYAAGDCCGPFEIVHIAVQQGEVAARNIATGSDKQEMDYRLLISVVFTDPQIATVGLTEKAAMARGVPFKSASYPFNDHGKSIIMNALHGFVKLLANPVSGEILGGCCVGPSGGELIHEIVAAMHKSMTVHELAALPHYHPTLAEIWTFPAEELVETIQASG